ncbi:hypothetical protein HGRIS_001185 [Hohenbuehelia grisea]|uniref:Transposase n=1 Tax=Hohenbuehelia grisea TaxID=104357 RepID=A0ABR3JP43_9AGAR
MRDEVKAFVCAEMAQALAPEAGVADLAFDPETRNLQDELALDNNVDPMSPTSLLYESSQTGECNEHLEESLSEEFPRLPGAWPIGEAVNFDQLLHDFAFTDEDPIPTYRRLFFALSSNTKKLPKMLSRRCGIILAEVFCVVVLKYADDYCETLSRFAHPRRGSIGRSFDANILSHYLQAQWFAAWPNGQSSGFA